MSEISGLSVCFEDVLVQLYIIHTYRVMVIIKVIIKAINSNDNSKLAIGIKIKH